MSSYETPEVYAYLAKLVRDGFVDTTTGQPIAYETPVFPLLDRHVPRLAAAPLGEPAMNDVTIGHLIEHVGGVPLRLRAEHGKTEADCP